MRKGLSTISVFSMAVSFGAAVVLSMQTPNLHMGPQWPVTAFTQWSLEVGLFGLAVLAGRRNVSWSGWIGGMAILIGVRGLISAASGYALAGFQTGPALAVAAGHVGGFAPRLAAAVFALMVVYPLRSFLPERSSRSRTEDTASKGEGLLLEDVSRWVMQGRQSLQVSPREEKTAASPTILTITSPEQYPGHIEVPLRVLLAGVPAHRLAPGSARHAETEAVSVPLARIVPQLNEARVILTWEDLRQILPPNVLTRTDQADSEGELTLVLLPLEEVVPQLPPAVLELPPPSPPAWAELPDPESVVFATV